MFSVNLQISATDPEIISLRLFHNSSKYFYLSLELVLRAYTRIQHMYHEVMLQPIWTTMNFLSSRSHIYFTSSVGNNKITTYTLYPQKSDAQIQIVITTTSSVTIN